MSDITVPQLGESVTEATVGSWLVKTGDSVSKDDILVELETDKVAVEVRAEADGVMGEIVAQEGDTVEIGAKLAELDAGGAAPKKSEAKAEAKPAETSEAPAKGGQAVDAVVPQMGESVSEGTIGSWLVKVGDTVDMDQALVEIETDKVAVEVPSPVAGVVAELLVGEGDAVAPGTAVARISEGAGGQAAEAAPAEPTSGGAGGKKAMPSAARVIEENKLDAGAIEGTGKDGRITKGDALKAAEAPKPAPAAAPATPKPAAPSAPRETGPREERVRMTRLRQTIAKRLKDAQNAAAILTTYNEADMSAIMAARKTHQEANSNMRICNL